MMGPGGYVEEEFLAFRVERGTDDCDIGEMGLQRVRKCLLSICL